MEATFRKWEHALLSSTLEIALHLGLSNSKIFWGTRPPYPTPPPPPQKKKRLVLIQSVTLIKPTGYFNNIVIEIPGEMIILFFQKIWLIFKVQFEVERSLFISLQICAKDESCQIQAVYM